VGDVFKALADPTRRTILDELTDRNGQTLFEICSRLTAKHGLGSSRQAISQHLDVLEAAGLVETSREGRYKFHYINTAPLEPIVERWLKRPGRTPVAASAPAPVPGGRDRHENQPGQRAR
jgi:DNA-binding transcriptional ArsR family regulator